MGAALKFKQAQVPRQQGEQARLKVIRGPDTGVIFILQGSRATIGRGEENDIILTDLKASRRHAELVMTPTGWGVKDLGSANGLSCNGQATRAALLRTKDTLGLGETLFEFMSNEAPTVVLQSPPPSEKQVESEQAQLAAQRAKIIAMSKFGGLAKNKPKTENIAPVENRIPPPAAAAAAAKKKDGDPKKLLLVLALLAGVYFLMDGPVKTKMTKRRIAKNTKQEEVTVDYGEDAVQIEKTAEMFYADGFREFNRGNYLRARAQFETVLQMMPSHPMAKRYLENSNKAIEDAVRLALYSGRRAECSGKLRAARGQYEHVLRLLFRDPSNPAHAQAKEHLDKLGSKKSLEECKG
jgi:pSer/pThr/pTyr-binding forkhead associated (FHA) protein